MTSTLGSTLGEARGLVTSGTDTGARIQGLDEAAAAARGRLDDSLVDAAQEVVDRAAGRLRLSATHTVVAIAGATGSGKSSTFNALTGLELSAVGVRRPTTSWASACVWGREGAEELLAWLGIPPRHQTTRDSMLDSGRRSASSELDGVVLLDLPDHDSTEVSHHLEVDRLVELADLLVWVLDPQKYADAAIHDRYLAPSAGHQDSMVVVLNHIDAVPEERRASMLGDVRRLLDADGLDRVPVLALSAREGTGVAELREEIARRAADKRATRARIDADVREVAGRLSERSGPAPARTVTDARVDLLEDAFAEAAGVPVVVAAVDRSTRAAVGRATGWPVTTALTGGRRDPAQRLDLDLGEEGRRLSGRDRTVPRVAQVERSRVDAEVRALADEVTRDLGQPWVDAVHHASVSRLDALGDRLDQALAAAEVGGARTPAWARVVQVLQWVLLLAAVGGLGWTAALVATGSLADAGPPEVGGLPLAPVLLVGGVVLGIVLGLLCRLLVAGSARRRAAEADRRLRSAVAEVSRELVVAPVDDELSACASVRSGLDRALA